MSGPTHWLSLTPQQCLINHNSLPRNANAISVRIYIRHSAVPLDTVLLRTNDPGSGLPPYQLPTCIYERLGQVSASQTSIRDTITKYLLDSETLKPESIIRLQIMDHSRGIPVSIEQDPDANGERLLQIDVLFSIDRKEDLGDRPLEWMYHAKLEDMYQENMKAGFGQDKYTMLQHADKYAQFNKATLLSIPPRPDEMPWCRVAAVQIIFGMIKAAEVTGWSEGFPMGFFILRTLTSDPTKPMLLLYPRTADQIQDGDDSGLANSDVVDRTIGRWKGPSGFRDLPNGDSPWRDLMKPDGTIRVKWVDPRSGEVLA